MDTILIDGTKYEPMVLDEVKDFEPKVIEHTKAIFGRGCEYFPKKKLTTIANNRRIPDGLL